MTQRLSRLAASARLASAVTLSILAFGCSSTEQSEPNYLIGSGIGDITSPIVDVPFSGYSLPTHIANGIHTRLNARAFVIGELDGSRRLAIVFVPSEATTMSGRRLRGTVSAVLGAGVEDVVIAGYTNDYAGYITTPEEYAVQQYEGGHTLFGPWTLPAFQQEIDRLARALADGSPAPSSTHTGDLRTFLAESPSFEVAVP